MRKLTEDIVQFLQRQGFVIVSTIDSNGIPHSSCKGILNIESNGRIYLLDLYRQNTYENLKRNPRISITAVDEHHFRGYCLKGKAKEIKTDRLKPHIIRFWEDKIASRVTKRVLKNIAGDKGHKSHPEALLPKPEYLIIIEVEDIIDLAVNRLK